MQICSKQDVPNDSRYLTCRQSRLAGVVRLLVCCGVLAIPLVVANRTGLQWLAWLGAAGALLVTPVLLLDLAALFRHSNWILQIGRDGVWINLRSYRDRTRDAGQVLHLRSSEIATVGRHIEAYSTPSKTSSASTAHKASGGSVVWRDEFLEIRLHDAHRDNLQAMLLSLRSPSAAGPKSRNQPREQSPYPIWFVGASVLRICWNSGHGRVVTPRLKRALDQFEQFASVAEPTRRDRPDWRELSAEEAAELARELALVHGDEQYSAALLVRLCGVTHNTAWNMIRRPGQAG